MEETQVKNLRNHVRNLPCFACLVRPICIKFQHGIGYIDTKNIFKQWAAERDKIIGIDTNANVEKIKIIREEILKVLRKEKERYAENGRI